MGLRPDRCALQCKVHCEIIRQSTSAEICPMKLRREGSIPRYGFLVVGAYCWSAAVVFGAELLDVVYSRAVSAVLEAGQLTRVFSGVSDLLLLMFAATDWRRLGSVPGAGNAAAQHRHHRARSAGGHGSRVSHRRSESRACRAALHQWQCIGRRGGGPDHVAAVCELGASRPMSRQGLSGRHSMEAQRLRAAVSES
jgi:hypothetical protein